MSAAPQPHPALAEILRPAHARSARFGTCPQAVWQPGHGHVPRGVLGATGDLKEVRAILVFAEPGGVYPGDSYPDAGPDDLLAATIAATFQSFAASRDLFHRNIRWFIDQIAPGRPFAEQLRSVWLTEGRLCSVTQEIGGLRDRSCADRYLARQVQLMPQATVVGFGGKAQAYLRALGIRHVAAYALAPPGANHRPARPSWEAAIEAIRRGPRD